MELPPLDGRGFLPAGLYKANRKEISNAFCTNRHRTHLWNSFLEFLSDVYNDVPSSKYPGITVNTTIVLSGSFFTDKLYPDDVDILFIIDSNNAADNWFWSAHLSVYNERIKAQYRVDFNIELPTGNDFLGFFSYIGPKSAEAKKLNPKELRGVIQFQNG